MRYLIAMTAAVAMALLSGLLVAQPIASWVVRQFEFDSPDSVASLHTAAYLSVMLVALAVGWALGWWLGRRFDGAEPV